VRGLELALEQAQGLAAVLQQRQGAEDERHEAAGKIQPYA